MADVTYIRAIGDAMHQRESVRFHIRLPVIFRWNDEQGGRQQNGGFTHDISTGGLFVYSPMPPPSGVCVELEVMLPPLEESGHGVRLRSEGRVLRIERTGERAGFAATGDFDLHNAQGSE
jgi:PilZ domain